MIIEFLSLFAFVAQAWGLCPSKHFADPIDTYRHFIDLTCVPSDLFTQRAYEGPRVQEYRDV